MELITEEIKESKNFQILSKVFSHHYVNKDNLDPIISYDEFKEVLINFIEEIMNGYLIKSGNINEQGSCEIVKFNKGKAGDCIDTKIRLDEDEVKEIFLGNLIIFTPYHELTHFKYNVDIASGKVYGNLVRYLKERLIRIDGMTFINGYDDFYYSLNYNCISIETLANMEGIYNLAKILNMMEIDLTKADQLTLSLLLKHNVSLYNKHLRDLTLNLKSNLFYQNFEDFFDLIVEDHPEWLDYKQLQIEYYKDDEGKVRKRTSEELQSLLEREEDEETRKYIESLVKQNKDKKEEKFKQKKYDYVKFSKITNANK